ncbi:hypothetical protein [Algoriphagus halophilus]|uniref:Uncharacterized protein n=1 Tax=Algoriphagus halophilus TaxID=226505 RepID=A0A1N6H0M3_9BACT|nr:hypothetical protein [Algoriphagus halophilus]SIO13237.1 hypothetical protein SAMN05444394_3442 [Algoriphagus halophilus]
MGNFFDDLLKKVFQSSEEMPVNHKENFIIKENELREALEWSQREDGREFMELINKNYHFKKAQINKNPQVHILESPYANGIAISYDLPFDTKSFSLLFLAFSQRVLALGYRQVSLDRKFEEINDQVKITEKFYFKPPLKSSDDGELISQLFGNITLEKISIDNTPSFIKLLVTIYSDRLYKDPKPFDQFLDLLFEVDYNG